jgi:hypothetical protein
MPGGPYGESFGEVLTRYRVCGPRCRVGGLGGGEMGEVGCQEGELGRRKLVGEAVEVRCRGRGCRVYWLGYRVGQRGVG